MRILVINMVFLLSTFHFSFSQDNDCNKLGAWLWHIETTGLSHSQLAERLSQLGVKRIYVKVADGGINPEYWPELIDENLVKQYKSKGLEIWSWSYNYPGNDSLQAEALYIASKTGYQGHIVDVEEHFDGDAENLFNLFSAFGDTKRRAINDGFAVDTFSVYCTTWGNPADHDFRVDVIDPFIDAFMPQTYVEVWGSAYMNSITHWIEVGNQEFKLLGATKPIHHIVSTEKDFITASQVNEFIVASGPQTSVWRVPGGGVPMSVWETWWQIDWHYDFCNPVSVDLIENQTFTVSPNPVSSYFMLHCNASNAYSVQFKLIDIYGRVVKNGSINMGEQVDVQQLASGLYVLILRCGENESRLKLIKQ